MINRTRMLEEFFQLVKIYCPSRGERQAADFLKKELVAWGAEVREDDTCEKIGGNAGNVIGYFKGICPEAPVLLFTAHMDSVEPCQGIAPQLRDGIITSTGETILGSDDKAGVAAILEGLRTILEQGAPHGDVEIVFTVAEEKGLDGAAHIDRNALRAQFGYAMDSSGAPGEIIVKAPGQYSIEAKIFGKSAHAGLAPEEGVNAITAASKAIAAMRQGRIDEETTANVGVIHGGQATNIVPDRVVVSCEARSHNADKLAAQTEHMQHTFRTAAAENGCRTEMEATKAYESYVLAETEPVVLHAAAAAEKIGVAPVLRATGGGSDANYFNAYGIPTAVLGVGMSKVHSVDEFIREEDLYRSAEWVAAIIEQAARPR